MVGTVAQQVKLKDDDVRAVLLFHRVSPRGNVLTKSTA
jgi:hypothetical protein